MIRIINVFGSESLDKIMAQMNFGVHQPRVVTLFEGRYKVYYEPHPAFPIEGNIGAQVNK